MNEGKTDNYKKDYRQLNICAFARTSNRKQNEEANNELREHEAGRKETS